MNVSTGTLVNASIDVGDTGGVLPNQSGTWGVFNPYFSPLSQFTAVPFFDCLLETGNNQEAGTKYREWYSVDFCSGFQCCCQGVNNRSGRVLGLFD